VVKDPKKSHINQYIKLTACVLFSACLWFFCKPDAVSVEGWKVFSVFSGVILSFVLRPVPMGVTVVIALLVLGVTKTIGAKELMAGYADTTVWLVVSAFLISGAVISTGFGKRIALKLVVWFGKTTLGLGYAICGAELILGPVVPSNTARGGGILAPIVNSLSATLGSTSDESPKKVGSYLTLVGSHANLITASMFLTGMAANPLVAKAASDVMDIEFGWGTWALGAIVPGIVGLVLLPLLLYKIAKPELTDGRKAQEQAKSQLNQLGKRLSWKEWVMLAVLVLMVALWATGKIHGIKSMMVALLGVGILLITKVQKWSEVIRNYAAWDTLIWLGGLLAMANLLKVHGMIKWFADLMQHGVSDFAPIYVVLALALIYFFSMYAFSMFTAHISAMVAPFLSVCLMATGYEMLAVALFAYLSCLSGSLTNYSSGPVVIYYGLGMVKSSKWFSTGFVVAIFHLIVWLGIGMIWWKVLGWY